MSHDATDPVEPVQIPYAQLSAPALQGVIEAFVLREGTEYGAREFSLAQKVEQVMRQLQRGEAHILFYPQAGTISIVPTDTKGRSRSPLIC